VRRNRLTRNRGVFRGPKKGVDIAVCFKQPVSQSIHLAAVEVLLTDRAATGIDAGSLPSRETGGQNIDRPSSGGLSSRSNSIDEADSIGCWTA
jgi:hypothetical protein